MGEEKAKGGDDNVTQGKKDENKKEDGQIIVLKVDMHCDACAKKVVKALRRYQGVEDVAVDRKSSTIAVKGEIAEPSKLSDRVRSKTGRNAVVISPLPKPAQVQEQPKDDNKKDQPPPVVTVVLGVQMHCEACAQLLQKRIRKIKGVECVETNVGNGRVTVKGMIPNPEDLAQLVYKKTRKQVSIIKEEEKKDDTKKEESKEVDEKGAVKNEVDNNNTMTGGYDQMRRYEYYWPPPVPPTSSSRYNSNYGYMNMNMNMMEHPANNNHINYDHPHFLSDENPNACSIM